MEEKITSHIGPQYRVTHYGLQSPPRGIVRTLNIIEPLTTFSFRTSPCPPGQSRPKSTPWRAAQAAKSRMANPILAILATVFLCFSSYFMVSQNHGSYIQFSFRLGGCTTPPLNNHVAGMIPALFRAYCLNPRCLHDAFKPLIDFFGTCFYAFRRAFTDFLTASTEASLLVLAC